MVYSLKKSEFDDDKIEKIMLNINRCAYVFFGTKGFNHYNVFITKLTEFADKDDATKKRIMITKLIQLVLNDCARRTEATTDTEAEED